MWFVRFPESASRRLQPPKMRAVARANFNPGQYRDLDEPLMKVDPDAPWRVRFGQRVGNVWLWVIIVWSVGFPLLIFLSWLIFRLTRL